MLVCDGSVWGIFSREPPLSKIFSKTPGWDVYYSNESATIIFSKGYCLLMKPLSRYHTTN